MRENIHPVEQEELMAYLDGELPVERAASTATHLQECRECQILAAELKSISESLTAWEVEPKESEMSSDLAKAFDEPGANDTSYNGTSKWLGMWRSRRLVPWVGGVLAGGAAALALVFAMVVSTPRSHYLVAPTAEQTQALRRPAAPPPTSFPGGGGDRDHLTEYSAAPMPADVLAQSASDDQQTHLTAKLRMNPAAEPPAAPMILRTAQLTVVTPNLDQARAGMDRIVQKYSGYVGDLTFSAPPDGPRKMTATVRVPASQLDNALAELKTLGRVASESQSGQDVTAQYIDLEARLSNSRNTEQRLIELLRQRTGKLSDVLEVETELSRVREEIERMEGERRMLAKQVAFASLTATVTEEYKAPARVLPDSIGTRFRNAAVDGYQSVINFVIGVALFLVSDGPMWLLWIAILFFPARYAWRKLRSR